MDNNVVLISWKDLFYKPDRDGGVSFFEKYIEYLLNSTNTNVHYLTAIWYSWWEYLKDKKIFQEKSTDFNPNKKLHIHKTDIEKYMDKSNYETLKNKFEKRLLVSDAESKSWNNLAIDWDSISRVHIFHVSHAVWIILNNTISPEKIVLHPMMTWKWYSRYTEVAKEYIELEKKVFEKVKIIQTPSLDEKNDLVDFYDVDPGKVVLNPRWYDSNIFISKARKLPNNGEAIKIVCANMIRYQKWQKYFVAFAELCRKNNILVKIQLIWVNKNSYDEWYIKYYNELLDEIREKKLENYFEFYDVMLPEQLNNLMLWSHVSIITSIYETFWKSALESCVSWLPTIVFDDIKPFNEFIENNVNWIKTKRDPESINLFNSFNSIINNRFVYEKISKNGIITWTKYNWENIFLDMEKDINNIINKYEHNVNQTLRIKL